MITLCSEVNLYRGGVSYGLTVYVALIHCTSDQCLQHSFARVKKDPLKFSRLKFMMTACGALYDCRSPHCTLLLVFEAA